MKHVVLGLAPYFSVVYQLANSNLVISTPLARTISISLEVRDSEVYRILRKFKTPQKLNALLHVKDNFGILQLQTHNRPPKPDSFADIDINVLLL